MSDVKLEGDQREQSLHPQTAPVGPFYRLHSGGWICALAVALGNTGCLTNPANVCDGSVDVWPCLVSFHQWNETGHGTSAG